MYTEMYEIIFRFFCLNRENLPGIAHVSSLAKGATSVSESHVSLWRSQLVVFLRVTRFRNRNLGWAKSAHQPHGRSYMWNIFKFVLSKTLLKQQPVEAVVWRAMLPRWRNERNCCSSYGNGTYLLANYVASHI